MRDFYEWEEEQNRKVRESIVRIEVCKIGGSWIHTPVDSEGYEVQNAIVTYTKCAASYLQKYFGVQVPVVRI
jgi:hypothetical protein